MDITYKPYIDPEFEYLIERINPPRVCIDNDSFPDCTLIKVDSANKQGMLLEMVQVLTDLDLVISKSYISSDGGWLMDVFHVTDQQGYKVTQQSILRRIQEEICSTKRPSKEVTSTGREEAGSTGKMMLEMTGVDRPGLLSEMSAVLAELGCNISNAVAWTHNGRVACIIYIEDGSSNGPLANPCQAAHVQAQLENVVEAHHYRNERRSLRLTATATHTERRLHQMMASDSDFQESCSCCCGCSGVNGNAYERGWKEQPNGCTGAHVKIENCKESGYSIVLMRCRDRPKLLFDTLCTLMDLQYVVSHAAISTKRSVAFQEYYLRHKNGSILDSEGEKNRVARRLVAATERRASDGLRLEVCTKNRAGFLSDVTRVFRENSLSITMANVSTRGEKAVGVFYVKDTSEQLVSAETLEILRKEIGGSVVVANVTPYGASQESKLFSRSRGSGNVIEPGPGPGPKFSFGNLLWSQLGRLSNNFRPIKS